VAVASIWLLSTG